MGEVCHASFARENGWVNARYLDKNEGERGLVSRDGLGQEGVIRGCGKEMKG